jgi:hypothetical protein
MPRRDPAKAVQVLDLVLEFFGDGSRWIKRDFGDGHGNRCLVGELRHIRRTHGMRADGAGYYLRVAMCNQLERVITPSFWPRSKVTKAPLPAIMWVNLMGFNDKCETYDELRQVIVEARQLAAADIEQQPARLAA